MLLARSSAWSASSRACSGGCVANTRAAIGCRRLCPGATTATRLNEFSAAASRRSRDGTRVSPSETFINADASADG